MLGDDLKEQFRQWGPGMYDPRHHYFDGMAIQTLIDPERFDLVPAYDLLERILVSVLPDLLGETLPAEPEAGASESGP